MVDVLESDDDLSSDVNINISWVQGKCRTEPWFVDETTLLLNTGSFLKLLSIVRYKEATFKTPLGGVQCVGCDAELGLVAFSSGGSYIWILKYPALEVATSWKTRRPGTVKQLVFTGYEYIITLEASAKLALTVWRWRDGQHLASVQDIDVADADRCWLTVSPVCYKLLAMQDTNCVHFFEIEDICKKVTIRHSYIFTPVVDGSDEVTYLADKEVALLTFFERVGHDAWGVHSDMLQGMPLSILYPSASDREVVQLYDRLCNQRRTEVASHCWTPENQVVVACYDETIVRITLSPLSVNVVVAFADKCSTCTSIITCMAINKNGLFYCTKLGEVHLVTIIDEWKPILTCQLGESPTAMKFSPSYKNLVFFNENCSVQVLETDSGQLSYVSAYTDDSPLVGLSINYGVEDFCMVARKSGLLESWETENGAPDTGYEFGEEFVCMSGLKSCSLFVTSSASLQLLVFEFANKKNFRVVMTAKLSEAPVTLIRPEPFCRLVVLVTADRYVFLYGIQPSKGFKVMGYVTTDADVEDVAVFCGQVGENIIVFLLSRDGNNESSSIEKFELPAEFVDDFRAFWEDASGVLNRDLLRVQTLELPSYCCSIVAHQSLGVILCLPGSRKIVRISPESFSSLSSESFEKCCELTEDGRNFRLILSPNGRTLLIVSNEGVVSIRYLDNFDVLDQKRVRVPENRLPCVAFGRNTVLIEGSRNEIVRLKVSGVSGDSRSRPNLSDQSRETENETLLKMPTSKLKISRSWIQETVLLANDEVIREYQKKKEVFDEQLQQLESRLNDLIADNFSAPEAHRTESEKFILDDDVKESMLESRREAAEVSSRKLQEKLDMRLQEVSNIRNECIDGMLVAGKLLKALKEGRILQNYSIPRMPETEKDRIQYSNKKVFLESCMRSKASDKDELYRPLPFEETDDMEEIFRKLRKQPFLLQSTEERVDYVYLLAYMVFMKRLQFNKSFDDCEKQKEDTVEEIRKANDRVRDIMRLIGEDMQLWEPSEEERDSYLIVTEKEVEDACQTAHENSDKCRSLAEDVLKEDWLLKRKLAVGSKYVPKLKKEQAAKLKKEAERKLRDVDQLVDKYQRRHEKLVEEKLLLDLELNQTELQIFMLLLSVDNFRNFRKWVSLARGRLREMEKAAGEYDEPTRVLETRVMELRSKIEKHTRAIADIDGEVERASKVSGNKQAFLEAYDRRPETATDTSTLDPYRSSQTVVISLVELDAPSNKPPKVPPLMWKQLCAARERKHRLEDQVRDQSRLVEECRARRKSLMLAKESTLEVAACQRRRQGYLHEFRLRCGNETPAVLPVAFSQLEIDYPSHLDFRRAMLLRRFHAEGLNCLLSTAGRKALDTVRGVARALYQIQRNEAAVRRNRLKTRDATRELELVKSIPLTKDVQKIVQDPRGFRLQDKIDAMERSKRMEMNEYARQVDLVRARISNVEVKKDSLRKSLRENRREIERMKGDIAEMKRIEKLRRKQN